MMWGKKVSQGRDCWINKQIHMVATEEGDCGGSCDRGGAGQRDPEGVPSAVLGFPMVV